MRNKGILGLAAFLALILVLGVVIYPQLADKYEGNLQNNLEVVDTPAAEIETESAPDAEPILAPDFTVYDAAGNEVHLSDFAGKPVVLNFWATWCTPCCQELPHFDEIHRKYGDSVTVVALHSNLVTDDVPGYLSKFDYQLPFALDADGSIIRTFGGSTMLPQTVVINPQGVITYTATGSVTLEKLEALLAGAK